MKQEKGIALIALVIIIIGLGFIIFSGLEYVEKYAEKQKVEDIKSNMLAIQSVITHINNKHTVDEENNPFIGTKIELENNTTQYEITEELKSVLTNVENLYVLSQEELDSKGIKEVIVNNKEFYVVDYKSGEIFYSLGINGKYKLSEI